LTQVPRLRSGFRQKARAALTPSNRLKFESLSLRHIDAGPSAALLNVSVLA